MTPDELYDHRMEAARSRHSYDHQKAKNDYEDAKRQANERRKKAEDHAFSLYQLSKKGTPADL